MSSSSVLPNTVQTADRLIEEWERTGLLNHINLRPFLSSNDPTSNELILSNYSVLRSASESLSLELCALRDQFTSIERSLRLVDQASEQYRAVCHPARRVPNELLREIFYSFVTDPDSSSMFPSNYSFRLAMLISHVSMRWREVALSYPKLWANVELDDTWFRDFETLNNGLLLGLQLERSAPCLLNVSISVQNGIPRGNAVLVVLFQTCNRWRSLSLTVPLSMIHVFTPIRASLCSLEHLALYDQNELAPMFAFGYPMTQVLQSPLDIFEFTPKLRTLTGSITLISHCKLPWKQISSYIETSTHSGRTTLAPLKFLEDTSNLKFCDIVADNRASYPDVSKTSLTKLLQVRLRVVHAEVFRWFITSLRFPSMTHLDIQFAAVVTGIPPLPASNKVQHLCLSETGRHSIVECISLIQSLRNLQTCCLSGSVSSDFLRRFLVQGDVAPMLQSIYVCIPQDGWMLEGSRAATRLPASLIAEIKTLRPQLRIYLDSSEEIYLSQYGWM